MTNTPKQIKKNKELEAGRYYHCFDLKTGDYSIELCQEETNGKYLGTHIWAQDDNNQALRRWEIFGPVEKPLVKGYMYCDDHFGFGFKSSCPDCIKK